MAFAFAFTSTHQDLLDSYEAYRTARTGVRAWVRGVALLFGFVWLLAVLIVLTSGRRGDTWWQPVVWVGIGVLIIYQFLIKPQLAKYRIRRSNAPTQDVRLTFTDAAIDVLVVGVISYQRSWSEIAEVIHAPRGIMMSFTDGTAHWIPNRVFKHPGERAALAEFVQARIPRADNRAA